MYRNTWGPENDDNFWTSTKENRWTVSTYPSLVPFTSAPTFRSCLVDLFDPRTKYVRDRIVNNSRFLPRSFEIPDFCFLSLSLVSSRKKWAKCKICALGLITSDKNKCTCTHVHVCMHNRKRGHVITRMGHFTSRFVCLQLAGLPQKGMLSDTSCEHWILVLKVIKDSFVFNEPFYSFPSHTNKQTHTHEQRRTRAKTVPGSTMLTFVFNKIHMCK